MTEISVITICMNNPAELDITCASVALQTRPPDRHIIVDSSDPIRQKAVRSIVESFNAEYLWVEPDGTYGAMANGLAHLQDSNYVIFLNATDWFAGRQTLELVCETIEASVGQNEIFIWGIGKTSVYDHGHAYFLKHSQTPEANWKLLSRGTIGLAHPSMVCRAGELRQLGVFSEPWHVALDYELALQLGKRWGAPSVLDFPTSYYDQLGGSGQAPFATLASKYRVRHKVLGWRSSLWGINALLWAGLRFTLRNLRDSAMRRTLLRTFGWKRFEMAPNVHYCTARNDLSYPQCCEDALISQRQ
jgi:hypothetical protein